MRFFCIEFRPKVPIAAQPFSCTAALEGCARRAATTASMAPHPPALTDLVGTVVLGWQIRQVPYNSRS